VPDRQIAGQKLSFEYSESVVGHSSFTDWSNKSRHSRFAVQPKCFQIPTRLGSGFKTEKNATSVFAG
jgi:hypothetical protein